MPFYNVWVRASASSSRRRAPQQERATLRRDSLLNAAGALFAEVGYGGATMTEIARRAGASIGALYDYFPDKVSIARALAKKYTKEADRYWAELLRDSNYAAAGDLAQLLVESILHFVRDRPGYAALLNAPIKYARSDSARRPLRLLFTKALRTIHPEMSMEQGLQSSRIVVELLKALLSVHDQVDQNERYNLTQRFKELLEFHISRH